MAKMPRTMQVSVKLQVNDEAIERYEAAQERFSLALREFQTAVGELQLASFGLAESIATPEPEPTEPEPTEPEPPTNKNKS